MTGSGPAEAAYVLEHAWVPTADGAGEEVRDEVTVQIVDGRFARVGQPLPDDARPVRLRGLTLPGLANAHSHVFHRALRGRAQTGGGTFWTWREQMYALAGRLDPDTLHGLAVAAYREMAAGGVSAVGEFHYLHHGPDGTPYDDPNAMGQALAAAADEAGVRLCLLDTCYLTGGIGRPLEGVQRRFGDGSGASWQERADELTGSDRLVVGAAVHSVRAVPLPEMRLVAEWADRFETPLHVHLSEQPAENAACLAAYGRTPTEVLAEAGVLGERTCVVHATHVGDTDQHRLGAAGCRACLCPTTERDLGDGIGPGRDLHEAGVAVTLGSDSHAVVDLFEEMRAVEMHERLARRARGHWAAAELLTAATATGQRCLGFPDAGRIAVGQRADLVTLSLESPRTAGCGASAETAAFAASAPDVTHVVVDGKVVHDGDTEGVGVALEAAVRRAWGEDG